MSILIKDMEMPKNCYECLVRNQGFSGDGMKCGKTGSVLSWYDGNKKRMDDCPLVHVPEHGRLIDADSLYGVVRKRTRNWAGGWSDIECVLTGNDIKNAPTIIEAEEGET